LSWFEVVFYGPHSAAISPPLVLHLLMFAWALWIGIRLWLHKDVSPGESLVLVIGFQQGVLLLFFAIFSMSLLTRVPELTEFFRSHLDLWLFPRLAGLVSCVGLCLAPKNLLGQKAPFVFLAICLGAGVIDWTAGEWRPREALVTVPPPSLTAVASFLLAGLTLCGFAGQMARERYFVHWTGLAVSLFPLALFLYWEQLGYAQAHVWFQYIRE
jgi:hypothetical protein